MRKRSCTDCGCLLLFIVFLDSIVNDRSIVLVLRHANIEQVIFPSDTYGNICGQGRLSHKPYLYFFNILKCATDIKGTIIDGCQTPQICVSQCPSVTFSVRPSKEVRQIELEHAICQYDITPNRDNVN
ncbi:hypothetical protein QR98_0058820 [Sarcoptes scabiei]|uniref:Uncharacterized protein n=1 Tax=Sarcoptes scabiei TaxID=52283 RepID=A0A132AA88_SARSC|nr:hypothetical protein QR98_0058820 [Sarcoptes scabiei]